jgi:hypothetical protein
VLLRNLKGMRYLARLLGAAGHEFHVLDLSAAEADGQAESEPGAVTRGPHSGDAGELLDERAKHAYRRRLAEIDEDIEQARAHADPARGERATHEREFLLRELSRAFGLGGRSRRAGSASERARAAVTRAIRQAIARIAEHHTALGQHLGRAIQTGTYCAYLPDPQAAIDWHL